MNYNYFNICILLSFGNYDYMFDFEFYFDGKMWIYVIVFGSLFIVFWFDGDDMVGFVKFRIQFGYCVVEYFIGSIYDYLFFFKVDIDVVSCNNIFEKIYWRGGIILEVVKS